MKKFIYLLISLFIYCTAYGGIVDGVGGEGTGGGTDDQTIDVFSLGGTTLSLSLEGDGEATKEVDLSSLQDGTGTDDQTAAEVSFDNTTSGMAATDVQGAIDEVEARVDTNDAKVSFTWDYDYGDLINNPTIPDNLTDFITQTAWRLFYSNGDGDVTELAFGTDGQVLTSTGASTAPAFEDATGGGAGVEDDAFGSGWDSDTTNAPSQNAVYDILSTLTGYQETIVVVDDDTSLTLSETPISNASVSLYINGQLQEQGAGKDYSISDTTITWLDRNFTLKATDIAVVNYSYQGVISNNAQITIVIDGGGMVLSTGAKGCMRLPRNITLTGWDIVSADGTSGSIVLDVWEDSYANFPPTVADTMIATGTKPVISSATKGQDATIDWADTTLTEGNYIRWNVDSVTSLKQVILTLYGT